LIKENNEAMTLPDAPIRYAKNGKIINYKDFPTDYSNKQLYLIQRFGRVEYYSGKMA